MHLGGQKKFPKNTTLSALLSDTNGTFDIYVRIINFGLSKAVFLSTFLHLNFALAEVTSFFLIFHWNLSLRPWSLRTQKTLIQNFFRTNLEHTFHALHLRNVHCPWILETIGSSEVITFFFTFYDLPSIVNALKNLVSLPFEMRIILFVAAVVLATVVDLSRVWTSTLCSEAIVVFISVKLKKKTLLHHKHTIDTNSLYCTIGGAKLN